MLPRSPGLALPGPRTGSPVCSSSPFLEYGALGRLGLPGPTQGTTAALTPTTASGTLSANWKPSQFAIAAQDWPAGSELLSHSVYVEGIAGALDQGPDSAMGNPDLLALEAPPGTADVSFALSYGRFLPSLWKERVQAYVTGQLNFDWEGGSIYYIARVGTYAPVDAGTATLGPLVSPPRLIRVAGRDASVSQTGVGLTPTLSWQAPRLGTPSGYSLTLYELTTNSGGLGVETLATLEVRGTQVDVPAGLLRAGRSYAVTIFALVQPSAGARYAPYRVRVPLAYAESATAPFSP